MQNSVKNQWDNRCELDWGPDHLTDAQLLMMPFRRVCLVWFVLFFQMGGNMHNAFMSLSENTVAH